MRLKYLIISLIFLTGYTIFADSPFEYNKKGTSHKKSISYPAPIRKIVEIITPIQKKINNQMAALTRKVKKERKLGTIIIILLLSFIYGIVHAVGPGHGKTLIFSYFLSEEGTAKKGILVGVSIGMLHSFSAIIIVVVMHFILNEILFYSIQSIKGTIILISYGIITFIGLFLIITGLLDLKKKQDPKNEMDISKSPQKSTLPLILTIGMIPCTGGILIMLFSLSMEIIPLGIISVIAMGMGMSITISISGIISIVAKNTVVRITSKKDRLMKTFQVIFKFGGGLLIFFLGIVLFFGNL